MRFQAGLRVEKQLSLRKYVRERKIDVVTRHQSQQWLGNANTMITSRKVLSTVWQKRKTGTRNFFPQARYITYARIFFRVTLALLKKVPETLVWLEKRLSLMHKFELVEFNWIKRKLRAWQMTLKAFENKVLFSRPTVFNTV